MDPEYHEIGDRRIKISVHHTPRRLGWRSYGYRATVMEVMVDVLPLAGGRVVKIERLVRAGGFCDTLLEVDEPSPGGEREALNVLSLRRDMYIAQFMEIFKQK